MRFLLVLIMSITFAHAIITIVPVEVGDKPGFGGEVSASLETKRGNTEKDEYSAGVKLSYDNNETFVLWTDFIGN